MIRVITLFRIFYILIYIQPSKLLNQSFLYADLSVLLISNKHSREKTCPQFTGFFIYVHHRFYLLKSDMFAVCPWHIRNMNGWMKIDIFLRFMLIACKLLSLLENTPKEVLNWDTNAVLLSFIENRIFCTHFVVVLCIYTDALI